MIGFLKSVFPLGGGGLLRASAFCVGAMIGPGISYGSIQEETSQEENSNEARHHHEEEAQDADFLASFGERLAQAARSNGAGRYSSSRCYQFVWADLRQVLGSHIDSTSVPSQSAYQFGDWADRNPGELASTFKLRRIQVYPEVAPLGSVIVWNPGQCGYSSRHGHIEIAVGGGRACSDFCGPIATTCSAPRIYAPMEGTSSTFCDRKALAICLRYNGGQPCYPRSGCEG